MNESTPDGWTESTVHETTATAIVVEETHGK